MSVLFSGTIITPNKVLISTSINQATRKRKEISNFMLISQSKGYVAAFKHEVNFCCSLIDVNNPLNSDITAQANTFEIINIF